MKRKNAIKTVLLLVAIVILIGGLWYWASLEREATQITSDVILFYGWECPHCQDVDKFLQKNKIADKIQFDRLEVFHNSKNRAILTAKAEECGVNDTEVGVPLLFDTVEKKCFIGAPNIEDFFTKKYNEIVKKPE